MRYQPHPCFAKNSDDTFRYRNLSEDDVKNIFKNIFQPLFSIPYERSDYFSFGESIYYTNNTKIRWNIFWGMIPKLL